MDGPDDVTQPSSRSPQPDSALESTRPVIAPWVQRALPKPPLSVRGEIRRGALVGGILALLGVPAGVLWAFVMPHLAVQKIGSPAYLIPVNAEDLAAMGGDLTLVAILLSLGIVSALVVLFWSRDAVLGPLLGLLFGGICCGMIAMAVGHLLVEGDHHAVFRHAEDGTVFQIRPYVRGRADFLTLPLFAGLVFLGGQLFAWITAKPTPRVRRGASSGAAVAESGTGPGPTASS